MNLKCLSCRDELEALADSRLAPAAQANLDELLDSECHRRRTLEQLPTATKAM